MTSVRELIGSTAAEFESAGLVFGHGTDSAWDEAVALVLGVTGLEDDTRNLGVTVEDSDVRRTRELAARRIDERVPLAYLLGRCRFAGLEFLVEPGIVIPRSPIGGLLAEGLQPWLTHAPRSVVDVCCGTGCLGILAALVFDDAAVTLVDIDPHALDVARRNVRLHGLEDRIRVVESDLLNGLPRDARFDLIVTNPPYVDAVDMASLPPEYSHEPAHGLAGGPEGIELIERLLAALPARLEPGGMIVCEVGNSAPALLRRHPDAGFVWPELPTGGEGVFLLFGDSVHRSSH